MLTFKNTHDALRASELLKGRVPAEVMPTLRQVSQSCGISLRVEPKLRSALESVLAGDFVDCDLYEVTNDIPVLTKSRREG